MNTILSRLFFVIWLASEEIVRKLTAIYLVREFLRIPFCWSWKMTYEQALLATWSISDTLNFRKRNDSFKWKHPELPRGSKSDEFCGSPFCRSLPFQAYSYKCVIRSVSRSDSRTLCCGTKSVDFWFFLRSGFTLVKSTWIPKHFSAPLHNNELEPTDDASNYTSSTRAPPSVHPNTRHNGQLFTAYSGSGGFSSLASRG